MLKKTLCLVLAIMITVTLLPNICISGAFASIEINPFSDIISNEMDWEENYDGKVSLMGIDTNNWLWPVEDNQKVYSPFNIGNSNLQKKRGGTHKGIDISNNNHYTVYAAKGGTVIHAWNNCTHNSNLNDRCNGGWGNCVKIKHSDGSTSIYAHLQKDSILVSVEQEVVMGQPIGKVGSSGSSSGTHLHLSILDPDGNYYNVNPANTNITSNNTTYSNDDIRWGGTINYLTDSKYYIHGNPPPPPPTSSEIKINLTDYPKDGFVPRSFSLKGSISSETAIQWITGIIIYDDAKNDAEREIATWTNPKPLNIKYYTIQGSDLDIALTFGKINRSGNYRLRIIANNGIGEPTIIDKPFTVIVGREKPSIEVTTIETGQRATVSSPNSSLQVHYTVNGTNERSGGGPLSQDFTTAGTYNISAWTTLNGGNDSVRVDRTVSVSQVPAPNISDVTYGEQNAWVTVSGSGNLSYSTDRSTPGIAYTGPIYLTESKTLKAMAKQYGYQSSSIAEKYIDIQVPDAPQLSLYNTKSKIAQGKAATVQWEKTARATSYTAYLYYNGSCVKTFETSGTTAAFGLENAGAYTIKVKAKNFKGESAESNSVTVEAMAPVTVKFVDKIVRDGEVNDTKVKEIQNRINAHDSSQAQNIEGNVISVQMVEYGNKPLRPSAPVKKGFTFAGYGDGLYKEATEDTIIDVLYEVNYYSVEFYDTSKDEPYIIGDTQKVMYTDSAVEPKNYSTPAGYVFSGWNVDNSKSTGYDYKYVDGDIKLYTVYSWENEDLPVYVEIKRLQRDDESYKADISIKTISERQSDDIVGRLIIALYTSEGRNVYTQIRDEDVKLGTQNHWTVDLESVTLAYNGKVSYAKAYVVATEGDKTGGAMSKAATCNDITYSYNESALSKYWSDWSDWSEIPVAEDAVTKVETKTQYRYRDKQYTQSDSSKYLDGWTYTYSDSYTGGWIDNGTNWVGEENSDYRRREVNVTWNPTYKTQWIYSRAYGWNRSGGYWLAYGWASGICTNIEGTGWLDSPLPLQAQHTCGPAYGRGYPNSEGVCRDIYWYNEATRTVENGGYNTYSYRDTYYTHHFSRWGDYSSWSDNYFAPTSERDVETRTVYRYRKASAVDEEKEAETLHTYNKSGKLENVNADFSGELATVMIYKKTNTDPTQEQIEYVDQITIGNGNSYEIKANTKEAIDYNTTGDFIVTLSLEGGKKLINVDYIKAPAPTYSVDFYLQGGELYKSVQVEKDRGVDVNSVGIPPAPEGYRFIKWDKSVVNVTQNISTTAQYEKVSVPIVFVDHENETVKLMEVPYGDPVQSPAVQDVPGKVFKRWKDISDSGLVAKEALVSTTIWEKLKFKVKFCDFEDNVIDEQVVEYGESAVLPDLIEKDGVVYSWDVTTNEWWNVTSDMMIYPYVPQRINLATPTISASTKDSYGVFIAELESSVPDGKIYYTVDDKITLDDVKEFVTNLAIGVEPSVDAQIMQNDEAVYDEVDNDVNQIDLIAEYNLPLKICTSNKVYAFVVDTKGNISPIAVFEYEDNLEGVDAGITPEKYIPDEGSKQITMPIVYAKQGDIVTVPVYMKNNTGIGKISANIQYDAANITVLSVENGDVFNADEFKYTNDSSGNCTLTWDSADDNTNNGVLAEITVAVNDNAADERYLLDLNAECTNSIGEEQYFVVVPGAVYMGASNGFVTHSGIRPDNKGVEITVTPSTVEEDILVAVVYDNSNRMTQVKTTAIDSDVSAYNITFDKALNKDDKLKVFVLKSLDSLTPLSKVEILQP